MSLTKAEWALVEEKLSNPHNPVGLECDGYHVTLVLARVSTTRLAVHVYVNGKVQFHSKEREHLTRFHYPSKRSVMSAKDKRALAKEPKWLQKRMAKESALFDPKAKYTTYIPWWGSFKALKAHFIKHNQDINLLKTWQDNAPDDGQE